jgi:GT2 family glycosyltransferase
VLLLNPDAIIKDGAIEALVGLFADDPRRGLVGGRTIRPDGSLDPGSCWGRPTLWSYFCSAVGLTSMFRRSAWFDPEALGRWQRDSVREVDIVSGCLLLSSREVWQELGGFDPLFFMYGEDADLSLRARAAGYRPSITPSATVVHALSATTGTPLAKQRLLLRGKVTLVRKHWPAAVATAGVLCLGGGIGLRALAEQLSRRQDRTMRTLWQERSQWGSGWSADPLLPRLAAGVAVPGSGGSAPSSPPGEHPRTDRDS